MFLAGREHSYPRNAVLLRALEKIGTVDVIPNTFSGSIVLSSLFNFLRALPRLRSRRYDLIFIGFYGHLLILLIGLITRVPILFDAFVSTYDTLCFDRQLASPQSLLGRVAFWLDQISCRRADIVLVDTALQADYFARTFNIAREKIQAVAVGCNEDIFFPRSSPPSDTFTNVLYYNTYQRLHGVEIVIRAAELLQSEAIRFRLIGNGPTFGQVRNIATKLNLRNLVFVPTVPLSELPSEISKADICLGGPFGNTAKAARVIPGKIYQILAMARPLLATNTPANTTLLSHAVNSYLCDPDSPEALASAIMALHQDAALTKKIAAGGRELYLAQCSEMIITEQLARIIKDLSR